MQITIKRRPSYLDATISEAKVNGRFQCYICEDVVRAPGVKVQGKTAIPAGTYVVIINRSNRFSAIAGHDVFLPLLLDLPGHTTMFGGHAIGDAGVRIHPGNTAVDTDGCLLPGAAVAPNKAGVTSSRVAFQTLFTLIQAAIKRGETVLLTIS
jgi:hypothetical protein